MLKADVFEDFKGSTTLLLWGDGKGMTALLRGLDALRSGNDKDFAITGPRGGVTIVQGEGSTLISDRSALRWCCSRETIKLVTDLVEPLVSQSGHQFLNVCGMAEQVIISRDEYPADLR
jgi:hypothetical protein